MDTNIINEHVARIKKLLDKDKFEEALELCSVEEFKSNALVQSLKVMILMRCDRYEEALEVANKALDYGYNQEIEERKIILIQILHGEAAALEECNKEINSNKNLIQLRKALILKKMNLLDEALEICEREEFSKGYISSRFLDLKKKIIVLKNVGSKELNEQCSLLLTKLYAGKVTKEEIESANIFEWSKEVLLLAYYEKTNKSLGLKLIKELKKKYENDNFKIRVLNNLFPKFNSKKAKLCDIGYYEELLRCKVNFDYAMELSKIVEEKIEKVEVKKEEAKIVEATPKKEKKKKVMVGSTGTNISSRYSNHNNVNNSESTIIHNNSEEDVLIKDYFKKEVDAIKKYLYASMYDASSRMSATKAYDAFENLTEKSINDKQALMRFATIVRKLESLLKIDMDITESKLEKVLK